MLYSKLCVLRLIYVFFTILCDKSLRRKKKSVRLCASCFLFFYPVYYDRMG